MELIKIVNARQVLDGLSEREDIGAHLSYWMTKFVVKTEGEYKFYVNEIQKTFEKYAEKTDDEKFLVPADKVDSFNTAIQKIGETDVESPGIRFDLSELASELKLSMKQMYPLLDFIDENK